MKKTIYCKPEIEVTSIKIENLLNGVSGNVDGNPIGEGGGGSYDDGTHDPDAKGFWDDEY